MQFEVLAPFCRSHEEDGNTFKILIRNPEGKEFLEDLSADGRVIRKFVMGIR
jgi:hypothetical protein